MEVQVCEKLLESGGDMGSIHLWRFQKELTLMSPVATLRRLILFF